MKCSECPAAKRALLRTKNGIESPEFKSYEEEATFWDNLDTGDFMEAAGEWFQFSTSRSLRDDQERAKGGMKMAMQMIESQVIDATHLELFRPIQIPPRSRIVVAVMASEDLLDERGGLV